MKKQFDIKAALRGGVAAFIPTFLILLGGHMLLDIEPSAKTVGGILILCGASFIFGMVYFGRKKVSEKDENPAD
jgi:hypothetical protein